MASQSPFSVIFLKDSVRSCLCLFYQLLLKLGHAQVFFSTPLMQKSISSGTVEGKRGKTSGVFGERQKSVACITPQRPAEETFLYAEPQHLP